MYGLLILNFVIPFVMIFVGYILKKHPVKDMNSGNGYNTPSSRKSQEHWDYAQSIAPNIVIGIGKTLGLVEIVLCISLLFLNISAQSTVFAGRSEERRVGKQGRCGQETTAEKNG